MALAVLFVVYQGASDPRNWQWLANENFAAANLQAPAEPAADAPQETIVPGPNDLDPDELAEVQKMFEAVTDRKPLQPREMPAYWRLMAWSRTQPLSELSARAARDIAITQLWEQPEKYRGKLIELQLHVRRVLEYEAPENSYGIAKVYELWGWTDESRSFPYVVVLPEKPAGLPIGTNVRTDVLFVGYFLKTMAFQAVDAARAAPLLVGRAKVVAPPSARRYEPMSIPTLIAVSLGLSVVLVGTIVWFLGKTRQRKARTNSPVHSVDQPFGPGFSAEPPETSSSPDDFGDNRSN